MFDISYIGENVDYVYLFFFPLLKGLEDLEDEVSQAVNDFLIEDAKVLKWGLVIFKECWDFFIKVVYLVVIMIVFERS